MILLCRRDASRFRPIWPCRLRGFPLRTRLEALPRVFSFRLHRLFASPFLSSFLFLKIRAHSFVLPKVFPPPPQSQYSFLQRDSMVCNGCTANFLLRPNFPRKTFLEIQRHSLIRFGVLPKRLRAYLRWRLSQIRFLQKEESDLR